MTAPTSPESARYNGSWAQVMQFAGDQHGAAAAGRKPRRMAAVEAEYARYRRWIRERGLANHEFVIRHAAWSGAPPTAAFEPNLVPYALQAGISHWVLWRHPDVVPGRARLDPKRELAELRRILAEEGTGGGEGDAAAGRGGGRRGRRDDDPRGGGGPLPEPA